MTDPAGSDPLYPKLRAFKKQHLTKDAFHRYDAHAIGIGRKVVAGKKTETLCLRFYVRHKCRPDDLPIERRIPASFRYRSENDDSTIELPTDVIEMAPFRFTSDPEGRFRPVPGGVSGGSVFTGTIGGWAWDRTDASFVMLTACHVVGFFDFLADHNAPFLQPGLSDGGKTSTDRVGSVKRLVELIGGETRTVDAAIAEPTSNEVVLASVQNIGPSIYAVENPNEGMAVQKSGKTTGLTQGEVVDEDMDTFVFLADDIFFFEDVVAIEAPEGGVWAEPGDSGSIVFSQQPLSSSPLLFPAVGLHFASADSSCGLACKMRNIFDQLELEPICDGLFANFVEEMAVSPDALAAADGRSPARGIVPFIPAERRLARAGSPAYGLAQDLRARLSGTGRGGLLTDLISEHRAALTDLVIREGDIRRSVAAALGPILKGAITTTDVLSHRFSAEDMKRLSKMVDEFERLADDRLAASVRAMAPLLNSIEGKTLSETFERGDLKASN